MQYNLLRGAALRVLPPVYKLPRIAAAASVFYRFISFGTLPLNVDLRQHVLRCDYYHR
jgi:hypothetical protein